MVIRLCIIGFGNTVQLWATPFNLTGSHCKGYFKNIFYILSRKTPTMSLEDSFILTPENILMFINLSRASGIETGVQESYIWLPGIVIATVYGLLIIIGIIGNVTLMRTFIAVKSMRTVPNLFMSSLALGDLLLLVTCAPVDASRYLADEWLFGRVGCKLIPFIQLTSVGVSVFTLTTLSADRYKAIVKPMDIQRSTAKISFRAAAIWLFSMTLAIPEAIFSDLHTFNIGQTNDTFVTCAPYPNAGELHPKIHSIAFFLIFYIIPLIIISVYYCLIACSLIRSASDIPVEAHLHIQKQIESRKRLAKTVLVFVVLFAVCWLPSHVIYLYRSYHYGQVDTSPGHFTACVCARVLAFINSCINPFALYLLSNSFHKQFNKQLRCCRHSPIGCNSQGTRQINMRLTSVKSTNHSQNNFIHGAHVCQEGCG